MVFISYQVKRMEAVFKAAGIYFRWWHCKRDGRIGIYPVESSDNIICRAFCDK